MLRYFISFIITLTIISACKKAEFNVSPDASLFVSADTLKFDTVFTTVGSITQSFKIKNDNDQKLRISTIQLMGGNSSAYQMNVNGQATNLINNIELDANDSIYVFVTVRIDPNLNNLPFIVSDSIQIQYNNNNRFIQLEAYGQNAHFISNETIFGNVTWTNDLPYVILGSLTIDTNATLQINEGCKIYCHANAPMLVDGTLQINGSKNNEVVFTGDRLDEYYRDLPASWPGIYFRTTSKNNQLHYAIVKNATDAISVFQPSTNSFSKLALDHCVIENALNAGLYALGSSIEMENCLLSNCGKNIYLERGGDYAFFNCTVAAYSNAFMLHNHPVMWLSNFVYQNSTLVSAATNAQFVNCIFWGEGGLNNTEVAIYKEGTNNFSVTFDHCLYKTDAAPTNSNIITCIENIDPGFDSIDVVNQYYNFRTANLSFAPGVDNGRATSFSTDLDNNPRSVGNATDIGCYEKQ